MSLATSVPLRLPAAMLAVAALAAAGCGSSSGSGSGSSSGSPSSSQDAARVKLSQCLRDHGVDIPDNPGQAGPSPRYNAASSPIGFSMLAIVGVCQARLGRAARLAPVRLVVVRDGRPTRAMSAISVTRSSSTEVCSAWMMLAPRRAELTSPAPSSTLRWRDRRDTRPSETLAQPPPSGGACCGLAPWPRRPRSLRLRTAPRARWSPMTTWPGSASR